MSFSWLTWSNPVSIWWLFLLTVSIVNVALWLLLYRHVRTRPPTIQAGALGLELMVFLSAAYVFGCAFRSVLPRADVQRICLFDTWLSSVLVGRSVATVAELCFAIQWALVLHFLARHAQVGLTRAISIAVVPLIFVAELSSWYAVISTNYLGNALENSLWTVTFLLVGIGLVPLLGRFDGIVRIAIASVLFGIVCYLGFMFTTDVPMYLARWQADVASGKELLGFFAGLHDLATRWTVTHDIAQWKDEIAWQSLYFSLAVWASLSLCGFWLVRDELTRSVPRLPRPSLPSRRLPVRAEAG